MMITLAQLRLLHLVHKVETIGGEFPISGGVEDRVVQRCARLGLLEAYNYKNRTHPKHRFYGYAKLTPDGAQVVDQNPLT